MKKILIGTTNPSKLDYFKRLLKDLDVELISLSDLNIVLEPDEVGQTPEQNALIKAQYYGQYNDYVICEDAGLYFLDYPLDDPIQPGLKVRRVNGKNLTDDEMIEYYTTLVKKQGTKILATYMNGFGIYAKGKLYSWMELSDYNRARAFYLNDHVVCVHTPGWPLDGIRVDAHLFEESEWISIRDHYFEHLMNFIKTSLMS